MKKYIMANWKNNKTVAESVAMVRAFSEGEYNLRPFLKKTEIVFAPSLMALPAVSGLCAQSGFGLSAQDMNETEAYGRVCARQLSEFCQYVVVGHSAARKAHGDSDEQINSKARQAVEQGMCPVICIGENERQQLLHLTGAVLESQLKQACFRLGKNEGLVVLYEPVWAMGTGLSLVSENIGILAGKIRTMLGDMFGETTAQTIRFLYAGSVTADNAAEICAQRYVDGIAVGSASLEQESFYKIVKAVYDSCGG